MREEHKIKKTVSIGVVFFCETGRTLSGGPLQHVEHLCSAGSKSGNHYSNQGNQSHRQLINLVRPKPTFEHSSFGNGREGKQLKTITLYNAHYTCVGQTVPGSSPILQRNSLNFKHNCLGVPNLCCRMRSWAATVQTVS